MSTHQGHHQLTCTGPGMMPGKPCDRPQVAKGLCEGHYGMKRRGRTLTPLKGPKGRKGSATMVSLGGARVPPWVLEALVSKGTGATLSDKVRHALEGWAISQGARAPSQSPQPRFHQGRSNGGAAPP